ncbi:ArsR/SmtB family transcription factor [Alkalilimnicola sp. S0819]|uniref:ArsR/SmtB family transcription factor n=1 Tax=Alkalilimnicola sp. S0819 TaxID=2613922 RepID=UPI00126148B8|nr:metalloregulator ArsR/SmtB family transcription factor [Alkalilimnicola sp. S0819]KAB7623182.1 helix-turn-helix transcriptional regulator [Alkalilimnicola sp. S0819]MPQ17027.1 metalloregulator ArsR/SmtB family transcription factor [Alkalilimnicola sp. S0819]
MKMRDAVRALGALSQCSRLSVFRLLVATGPEGLCAGDIARRLELAPATLSFHLKELTHADLVTSRQQGRYVIYSPRLDVMNALLGYLTENCCGNRPALCRPAPCPDEEPTA